MQECVSFLFVFSLPPNIILLTCNYNKKIYPRSPNIYATSFGINFSKVKTKFCLSLQDNCDNSCLFVNGKEIYKLRAYNKNFNEPTQFFLGSISNTFSATNPKEVFSKGNLYDFSDDYNFIDKSDILNIHKYLMVKNSKKSI